MLRSHSTLGSRYALEPSTRCWARVCSPSPQGGRYEPINWVDDYYGLMLKVNIFLLNIKNVLMNLHPSTVINGLTMANC